MGGVTARLRVDTLDNLRLPRSGYEADVQVYASRQSLGAADDYMKLSASFIAAAATGPHSLRLNLRGASSAGGNTLPAYELSAWVASSNRRATRPENWSGAR